MTFFARFRSAFSALVTRRSLEREMEEEWQSHIDARADAFVASGLSADDAARRARLEFGDTLRWKEQSREARGLGWLHDLSGDASYAFRQLRRAPIVSIVAVATLALGIGANTAIFSLINSVLLRPMPVRSPEQLVLLADPSMPRGLSYLWNYAVWEEIRRTPELFDGAFGYFASRFDLAPGGEVDFADGLWATGGFFDVLGVSAVLGRTFTDDDDRAGGGAEGPVAVVSYAFWQRRFAGAAEAVGRKLVVDRTEYTIVGVLPRGFYGPAAGHASDVILPAALNPMASSEIRGAYWLTIMGRLRPHQALEEAVAALRAIQPRIRDVLRPPGQDNSLANQRLKSPLTLFPASGGNRLVSLQYERPLLMMLAIVALVLLVACANIANLLLARAAARRHEWSVRSALGGSRWRLARQTLVESFVLAGLGAAGGAWLAEWGGQLLVRFLATQTNALFLDLTLDMRVLAFTAAVAIAAALLFGIVPALRTSQAEPIDTLKEHGQMAGPRGALANGFVVAQVALSLVLVVAAGLFARSLANLTTMDLGFDPRGILVVNLRVPQTVRAGVGSARTLEEVRRAVAALPGVSRAAVAWDIPVGGGAGIMPVEIVGRPPLPQSEADAFGNAVGPGWFAVFGTPILAGRDFTDADGARPLVIVNRAFARKFLNGASPIGHVVRQMVAPPSGERREWEIVGMVGDAVEESLRDAAPPMMYHSFEQLFGLDQPLTDAFLSVRSAGVPPSTLTPSVSKTIRSVNPDLSLIFQTMTDVVGGSIAQDRALAILLSLFGVLALLLAAIGLYGVTAYAVSCRLGEIAIRMALGADRAGVIRLVMSRVTLFVGIGIVAGVAASTWLSRFAAPLLYGLEARDPLTLLASTLILAAVGSFAGWLPAYRVSRIDPAVILRDSPRS